MVSLLNFILTSQKRQVRSLGAIYIRVLLDSFLLNLISKEFSRAEVEYMNIHPPPTNAATLNNIYIPIFFLSWQTCRQSNVYRSKQRNCMHVHVNEAIR